MNEALRKKLMGIKDSRGKIGEFSRGSNVYNGGSSAARRGGGYGIGRPKRAALERRLRVKRK